MLVKLSKEGALHDEVDANGNAVSSSDVVSEFIADSPFPVPTASASITAHSRL